MFDFCQYSMCRSFWLSKMLIPIYAHIFSHQIAEKIKFVLWWKDWKDQEAGSLRKKLTIFMWMSNQR